MWNLGQQIFKHNFKAERGCDKCALPLAVRDQREQREDPRRLTSSSQCRFGEIIYDVVVGLCQSKMRLTSDDDHSEQDLAVWIGGPMPGMEGVASQLVRVFFLWTRAVREQVSKRQS